MINFTSQDKTSLQHASLLRKVITQRLTGTLHFASESEEVINIEFHKGDMVGANASKGSDAPIVENLRKFLSLSISKFAWEECPHEAKSGWITPEIALSKSITNLPLSHERVTIYREAFSKLPSLTLKPNPIHRYGFGDETEYQYLYQLSLRSNSFKVSDFFRNLSGNISPEDVMLRQVRTILFAFLLGYLVPVAGGQPKNSGRAGIASRIMQRFRRG